MKAFSKKFFILTAHPEDMEVGCGGLVAKILAHGGSVTNLIMVQPAAEEHPKRNQEVVKKELANSNAILKHKTIIYDTPLHNNDRPNLTLTNNVITDVEKIAKGHDILISHWQEDHHQDHRACHKIARSIARKNFEQFWCMDQTPYNLHYKNFKCNLYIDISDYIDTKRKSIEAYNSYFYDSAVNQIINYNKYRGEFLGSNKIAETFQIMYKKDV